MRRPSPDAVTRLLGHRLMVDSALRLTAGRLRVLAYHAVPDPRAFSEQLDWLVDRCTPVSEAQVIAALDGSRPLPPRAVWLTFDDAYPDVVEHALPILEAKATPATLFVCPSVVDTNTAYWWQVVASVRMDPGPFKLLADRERRRRIDALADQYRNAHGRRLGFAQLSLDQLHRWVASGRAVGNHTWDHPLLDRCEPEEQRHQIVAAHDRLTTLTGAAPRSFAYPNGNWSATAERVLREIGYGCAVGFDHRMARPGRTDRLRLSRLRMDALAPPARARAITSGLHPMLLHLRQRLVPHARNPYDPQELPR